MEQNIRELRILVCEQPPNRPQSKLLRIKKDETQLEVVVQTQKIDKDIEERLVYLNWNVTLKRRSGSAKHPFNLSIKNGKENDVSIAIYQHESIEVNTVKLCGVELFIRTNKIVFKKTATIDGALELETNEDIRFETKLTCASVKADAKTSTIQVTTEGHLDTASLTLTAGETVIEGCIFPKDHNKIDLKINGNVRIGMDGRVGTNRVIEDNNVCLINELNIFVSGTIVNFGKVVSVSHCDVSCSGILDPRACDADTAFRTDTAFASLEQDPNDSESENQHSLLNFLKLPKQLKNKIKTTINQNDIKNIRSKIQAYNYFSKNKRGAFLSHYIKMSAQHVDDCCQLIAESLILDVKNNVTVQTGSEWKCGDVASFIGGNLTLNGSVKLGIFQVVVNGDVESQSDVNVADKVDLTVIGNLTIHEQSQWKCSDVLGFVRGNLSLNGAVKLDSFQIEVYGEVGSMGALNVAKNLDLNIKGNMTIHESSKWECSDVSGIVGGNLTLNGSVKIERFHIVVNGEVGSQGGLNVAKNLDLNVKRNVTIHKQSVWKCGDVSGLIWCDVFMNGPVHVGNLQMLVYGDLKTESALEIFDNLTLHVTGNVTIQQRSEWKCGGVFGFIGGSMFLNGTVMLGSLQLFVNGNVETERYVNVELERGSLRVGGLFSNIGTWFIASEYFRLHVDQFKLHADACILGEPAKMVSLTMIIEQQCCDWHGSVCSNMVHLTICENVVLHGCLRALYEGKVTMKSDKDNISLDVLGSLSVKQGVLTIHHSRPTNCPRCIAKFTVSGNVYATGFEAATVSCAFKDQSEIAIQSNSTQKNSELDARHSSDADHEGTRATRPTIQGDKYQGSVLVAELKTHPKSRFFLNANNINIVCQGLWKHEGILDFTDSTHINIRCASFVNYGSVRNCKYITINISDQFRNAQPLLGHSFLISGPGKLYNSSKIHCFKAKLNILDCKEINNDSTGEIIAPKIEMKGIGSLQNSGQLRSTISDTALNIIGHLRNSKTIDSAMRLDIAAESLFNNAENGQMFSRSSDVWIMLFTGDHANVSGTVISPTKMEIVAPNSSQITFSCFRHEDGLNRFHVPKFGLIVTARNGNIVINTVVSGQQDRNVYLTFCDTCLFQNTIEAREIYLCLKQHDSHKPYEIHGANFIDVSKVDIVSESKDSEIVFIQTVNGRGESMKVKKSIAFNTDFHKGSILLECDTLMNNGGAIIAKDVLIKGSLNINEISGFSDETFLVEAWHYMHIGNVIETKGSLEILCHEGDIVFEQAARLATKEMMVRSEMGKTIFVHCKMSITGYLGFFDMKNLCFGLTSHVICSEFECFKSSHGNLIPSIEHRGTLEINAYMDCRVKSFVQSQDSRIKLETNRNSLLQAISDNLFIKGQFSISGGTNKASFLCVAEDTVDVSKCRLDLKSVSLTLEGRKLVKMADSKITFSSALLNLRCPNRHEMKITNTHFQGNGIDNELSVNGTEVVLEGECIIDNICVVEFETTTSFTLSPTTGVSECANLGIESKVVSLKGKIKGVENIFIDCMNVQNTGEVHNTKNVHVTASNFFHNQNLLRSDKISIVCTSFMNAPNVNSVKPAILGTKETSNVTIAPNLHSVEPAILGTKETSNVSIQCLVHISYHSIMYTSALRIACVLKLDTKSTVIAAQSSKVHDELLEQMGHLADNTEQTRYIRDRLEETNSNHTNIEASNKLSQTVREIAEHIKLNSFDNYSNSEIFEQLNTYSRNCNTTAATSESCDKDIKQLMTEYFGKSRLAMEKWDVYEESCITLKEKTVLAANSYHVKSRFLKHNVYLRVEGNVKIENTEVQSVRQNIKILQQMNTTAITGLFTFVNSERKLKIQPAKASHPKLGSDHTMKDISVIGRRVTVEDLHFENCDIFSEAFAKISCIKGKRVHIETQNDADIHKITAEKVHIMSQNGNILINQSGTTSLFTEMELCAMNGHCQLINNVTATKSLTICTNSLEWDYISADRLEISTGHIKPHILDKILNSQTRSSTLKASDKLTLILNRQYIYLEKENYKLDCNLELHFTGLTSSAKNMHFPKSVTLISTSEGITIREVRYDGGTLTASSQDDVQVLSSCIYLREDCFISAQKNIVFVGSRVKPKGDMKTYSNGKTLVLDLHKITAAQYNLPEPLPPVDSIESDLSGNIIDMKSEGDLIIVASKVIANSQAKIDVKGNMDMRARATEKCSVKKKSYLGGLFSSRTETYTTTVHRPKLTSGKKNSVTVKGTFTATSADIESGDGNDISAESITISSLVTKTREISKVGILGNIFSMTHSDMSQEWNNASYMKDSNRGSTSTLYAIKGDINFVGSSIESKGKYTMSAKNGTVTMKDQKLSSDSTTKTLAVSRNNFSLDYKTAHEETVAGSGTKCDDLNVTSKEFSCTESYKLDSNNLTTSVNHLKFSAAELNNTETSARASFNFDMSGSGRIGHSSETKYVEQTINISETLDTGNINSITVKGAQVEVGKIKGDVSNMTIESIQDKVNSYAVGCTFGEGTGGIDLKVHKSAKVDRRSRFSVRHGGTDDLKVDDLRIKGASMQFEGNVHDFAKNIVPEELVDYDCTIEVDTKGSLKPKLKAKFKVDVDVDVTKQKAAIISTSGTTASEVSSKICTDSKVTESLFKLSAHIELDISKEALKTIAKHIGLSLPMLENITKAVSALKIRDFKNPAIASVISSFATSHKCVLTKQISTILGLCFDGNINDDIVHATVKVIFVKCADQIETILDIVGMIIQDGDKIRIMSSLFQLSGHILGQDNGTLKCISDIIYFFEMSAKAVESVGTYESNEYNTSGETDDCCIFDGFSKVLGPMADTFDLDPDIFKNTVRCVIDITKGTFRKEPFIQLCYILVKQANVQHADQIRAAIDAIICLVIEFCSSDFPERDGNTTNNNNNIRISANGLCPSKVIKPLTAIISILADCHARYADIVKPASVVIEALCDGEIDAAADGSAQLVEVVCLKAGLPGTVFAYGIKAAYSLYTGQDQLKRFADFGKAVTANGMFEHSIIGCIIDTICAIASDKKPIEAFIQLCGHIEKHLGLKYHVVEPLLNVIKYSSRKNGTKLALNELGKLMSEYGGDDISLIWKIIEALNTYDGECHNKTVSEVACVTAKHFDLPEDIIKGIVLVLSAVLTGEGKKETLANLIISIVREVPMKSFQKILEIACNMATGNTDFNMIHDLANTFFSDFGITDIIIKSMTEVVFVLLSGEAKYLLTSQAFDDLLEEWHIHSANREIINKLIEIISSVATHRDIVNGIASAMESTINIRGDGIAIADFLCSLVQIATTDSPDVRGITDIMQGLGIIVDKYLGFKNNPVTTLISAAIQLSQNQDITEIVSEICSRLSKGEVSSLDVLKLSFKIAIDKVDGTIDKQTICMLESSRALFDEMGISNPAVLKIHDTVLALKSPLNTKEMFAEIIAGFLSNNSIPGELVELITTICQFSFDDIQEHIVKFVQHAIGLPTEVCNAILGGIKQIKDSASVVEITENIARTVSKFTGLDEKITRIFMIPIYAIAEKEDQAKLVVNQLETLGSQFKDNKLLRGFIKCVFEVYYGTGNNACLSEFGVIVGNELIKLANADIPEEVLTALIAVACSTTEERATNSLIKLAICFSNKIGIPKDLTENIILVVMSVIKRQGWKDQVSLLGQSIATKIGIPTVLVTDTIDTVFALMEQSNAVKLKALLKLGGTICKHCGIPERIVTPLVDAIDELFCKQGENTSLLNLSRALAKEFNVPDVIVDNIINTNVIFGQGIIRCMIDIASGIFDKNSGETPIAAFVKLCGLLEKRLGVIDPVVEKLVNLIKAVVQKSDQQQALLVLGKSLSRYGGKVMSLIWKIIDALNSNDVDSQQKTISEVSLSIAQYFELPGDIIESIVFVQYAVLKGHDKKEPLAKLVRRVTKEVPIKSFQKIIEISCSMATGNNDINMIHDLVYSLFGDFEITHSVVTCFTEVVFVLLSGDANYLLKSKAFKELLEEWQIHSANHKIVIRLIEVVASVAKHRDFVQGIVSSIESTNITKTDGIPIIDVLLPLVQIVTMDSHDSNRIVDIYLALGRIIDKYLGYKNNPVFNLIDAAALISQRQDIDDVVSNICSLLSNGEGTPLELLKISFKIAMEKTHDRIDKEHIKMLFKFVPNHDRYLDFIFHVVPYIIKFVDRKGSLMTVSKGCAEYVNKVESTTLDPDILNVICETADALSSNADAMEVLHRFAKSVKNNGWLSEPQIVTITSEAVNAVTTNIQAYLVSMGKEIGIRENFLMQLFSEFCKEKKTIFELYNKTTSFKQKFSSTMSAIKKTVFGGKNEMQDKGNTIQQICDNVPAQMKPSEWKTSFANFCKELSSTEDRPMDPTVLKSVCSDAISIILEDDREEQYILIFRILRSLVELKIQYGEGSNNANETESTRFFEEPDPSNNPSKLVKGKHMNRLIDTKNVSEVAFTALCFVCDENSTFKGTTRSVEKSAEAIGVSTLVLRDILRLILGNFKHGEIPSDLADYDLYKDMSLVCDWATGTSVNKILEEKSLLDNPNTIGNQRDVLESILEKTCKLHSIEINKDGCKLLQIIIVVFISVFKPKSKKSSMYETLLPSGVVLDLKTLVKTIQKVKLSDDIIANLIDICVEFADQSLISCSLAVSFLRVQDQRPRLRIHDIKRCDKIEDLLKQTSLYIKDRIPDVGSKSKMHAKFQREPYNYICKTLVRFAEAKTKSKILCEVIKQVSKDRNVNLDVLSNMTITVIDLALCKDLTEISSFLQRCASKNTFEEWEKITKDEVHSTVSDTDNATKVSQSRSKGDTTYGNIELVSKAIYGIADVMMETSGLSKRITRSIISTGINLAKGGEPTEVLIDMGSAIADELRLSSHLIRCTLKVLCLSIQQRNWSEILLEFATTLLNELDMTNSVVRVILHVALRMKTSQNNDQLFVQMVAGFLLDAGVPSGLVELIAAICEFSDNIQENVLTLVTDAMGLPTEICNVLLDCVKKYNQHSSVPSIIEDIAQIVSKVIGLNDTYTAIFLLPMYAIVERRDQANDVLQYLSTFDFIVQDYKLVIDFIKCLFGMHYEANYSVCLAEFGMAVGTELLNKTKLRDEVNILNDVLVALIEVACSTSEGNVIDSLIKIAGCFATQVGMPDDIVKNTILVIMAVIKGKGWTDPISREGWKVPLSRLGQSIAIKLEMPTTLLTDTIDTAFAVMEQSNEIDALLKLGGTISKICGIPERITTSLVDAIRELIMNEESNTETNKGTFTALLNFSKILAMEVNIPGDIVEAVLLLFVGDEQSLPNTLRKVVCTACKEFKVFDGIVSNVDATLGAIIEGNDNKETVFKLIDLCEELAKEAGLPFDIIRAVVDVCKSYSSDGSFADMLLVLNLHMSQALEYPRLIGDSVINLVVSVYKNYGNDGKVNDITTAVVTFHECLISPYVEPYSDVIRQVLITMCKLPQPEHVFDNLLRVCTLSANHFGIPIEITDCIDDLARVLKEGGDFKRCVVKLCGKMAQFLDLPQDIIEKSVELMVVIATGQEITDLIAEYMEMVANYVKLPGMVAKHVTRTAIQISRGDDVENVLGNLAYNIGPSFDIDPDFARKIIKVVLLVGQSKNELQLLKQILKILAKE